MNQVKNNKNPNLKRKYYHFIAVVYRKTAVFDNAFIRERVKEVFLSIAKELKLKVLSIHVAVNHVHLLVERNELITLKETSKKLFGVSSLLLRREFPQLKQMNEKALWGDSNKRVYIEEEKLQYLSQYISKHSITDVEIEPF